MSLLWQESYPCSSDRRGAAPSLWQLARSLYDCSAPGEAEESLAAGGESIHLHSGENTQSAHIARAHMRTGLRGTDVMKRGQNCSFCRVVWRPEKTEEGRGSIKGLQPACCWTRDLAVMWRFSRRWKPHPLSWRTLKGIHLRSRAGRLQAFLRNVTEHVASHTQSPRHVYLMQLFFSVLFFFFFYRFPSS